MTHSFWVETLTTLKTAQSELTFLQQQVQLVDGRTPKTVWCASEAVLGNTPGKIKSLAQYSIEASLRL